MFSLFPSHVLLIFLPPLCLLPFPSWFSSFFSYCSLNVSYSCLNHCFPKSFPYCFPPQIPLLFPSPVSHIDSLTCFPHCFTSMFSSLFPFYDFLQCFPHCFPPMFPSLYPCFSPMFPSLFPFSVSPIVSISCFPTVFYSFLPSHVASDWTLLLELKNLSIAPSDLYTNTIVLTCFTRILSLLLLFWSNITFNTEDPYAN